MINESTLPIRMKDLPRDERGYPVPWFVDWLDGKPEFRAMDGRKLALALKESRCWVCGERLGVHMCFVAGPMCGINRISAEPPSHIDCARWSAQNCPFLANPTMVRRQDEVVNNAKNREAAAGMMITRNPGVTMLWITREFEVVLDDKNRPLISMGEPENVEWWAYGRRATRDEVDESVATGLPILQASVQPHGPAAMAALEKQIERFQRYLPSLTVA